MRIVIDGETVNVNIRVRLRWEPAEDLIRERIPIKELLHLECVALNGALAGRRVRLEEIAELEACLGEIRSEGTEQ